MSKMPRLRKDWENSHTVTVGQLIAKLAEYPPDMPVAYTWEGQTLPVRLDAIEIVPDSKHVFGPVLLLDADQEV